MRKKHVLQPKELQVVWSSVDDLHPSDYNPREIEDEAVEKLMESIRTHGFIDPCIANSAPGREGVLIAGHARLKAARRLGWKTVPVIFIYEPDLEREQALNVRLNVPAGQWSFEKLRDLFTADFLVDVGFSDSDLQRIFDDALETEDDAFDVEAELAAIKKPASKIGDLYQLGDHRLIVGDSTDPTVVKRLMDGAKVTMVDIDPPFSIGLDYDKGVSGKKHYGGKTNDRMSEKQYTVFLRKLMINALSVAEPDAHFFFWSDQNWVWLVQTLFRELGIKHQRICWWLKGNFSVTPNVAINKAGEAAIYGITGSPYLAPNVTNLYEFLDKDMGPGCRMIQDALDLFSLWTCQRLAGSEMEHPTEKKPSLREKALRRCSRPGDNILDLTAGSGSLLIAAEQMRRRAYVAEIEPIFADLCIRRWESLTGLKASLLSHE